MRIGSGAHTYEWIDGWAQLPESATARGGWAHPGVAVTDGGDVITFHPGEPTLLFFRADGALVRTLPTDLVEGHGITVSKEGDADFLWIADYVTAGKPRIKADWRFHQYSSEPHDKDVADFASKAALVRWAKDV